MNERTIYTSWVRTAVFIIGLALPLCSGAAYAESAKGDYIPSLLPAQEDQSTLIRRLRNVRRDIEAYQLFAENFHSTGDTKTLAQLQTPVDDFLMKHVDNLLAQDTENSTLETTRLSAEIMFIKTRLFMSLNREEAAKNTVADMKKRFGSYKKISVELPGKTTSLDEGIRLIDEELANTATLRKK
jgi:hypothetical protein